MSEEKTIDDLLRELAKLILEEAIDSENPQFRLDAFRAVQSYGKGTAKPAPAEPTGGMAAWGARLRQVQRAAEVEDGDVEAEADRA